MTILFMALTFFSFLLGLYSLAGLLFPRLPLVRTRGRAAKLLALGMAGFVGFAVAGGASMPPEERAMYEQQRIGRQQERERQRAVEQAKEQEDQRQAEARKQVTTSEGATSSSQSPSEQTQRTREDATRSSEGVELTVLLASYKDNELAADSAYKSKTVQLGGIVNDVKKDIFGRGFIIVGTGDEFEVPAVQCTLTRSAEGRAAALHKGDTVTVRGEITGLILLHVQMRNCEVM